MNHYKFKYRRVFSATFDKQDGVNQVLDETELYINLNIDQNLTLFDTNDIDKKSPLKNQIQKPEMKDSGWRFDKTNSMTISFYKTTGMNGSSSTEILLRSSAILKIENADKYCFLWLILAHLYPCKKSHANRVSN